MTSHPSTRGSDQTRAASGNGSGRRTITALLCILAVSLTVRLIHFGAIVRSGSYRLPTVYRQTDMRAFLDWSDEILAGDVLQRNTFHPFFDWMRPIAPPETWYHWWGGREIFQQEPLYVYLLSGVRWVTARAMWVPPLLQLLIGSLQPLVIFFLARRLIGEVPALIAAAIAALYGPFIFYQGVVLRDWLPPLLEPLALYLVLRAAQNRRPFSFLIAGFVLAICTLTKSLILLFVPVAIIWLALNQEAKRRWALPLWALAGFVIGVIPLVARNVAVGAPVFSIHNRTAEGFIQGNAIDTHPVGLFHPPSMKDIFEKSDGRLTAVVIETLRPYKNHWAEFFNLSSLKLCGIFEPIDVPNNVSFDHAREISPILRVTIPFAPIAFAGLAGLAISIHQRRPHGLILLYLFTQILALMSATVLGRYRLSLVAVLIIYAAVAIYELWRAIQCRSAVRTVTIGILLAASAGLEYLVIPIPSIRQEEGYEYYLPEYLATTTLHVTGHDYKAAIAETDRLAAWSARFPDAGNFAHVLQRDIHHVWARELLDQGDRGGALDHARQAAEINVPAGDYDHVHIQLGELFMRLHAPSDAATQFRLYLKKQPRGPLADKARNLLSESRGG